MADTEVVKKRGATRKPVEVVEPPLLKDGKTRASEDALDKSLKRYGVPVPAGATVVAKFNLVQGWLDAKFAELQHTCDPSCNIPGKSKCPMVACGCEEIATIDTDWCPYCGDGGLPAGSNPIVPSPNVVAAADAAEPEDVEPPLPADPIEEEDAGPVTQPVSDDGPQVDEEPLPDGDDAEPEAPAAAAEPSEAAPEESGELDVVADEGDLVEGGSALEGVILGPEGAPLPPDATPQQQLQHKQERIQSLKTNVAADTYDLGMELRSVNESMLYKAGGYKNFVEWVESTTGIKKTLAYDLMAITEKFDRSTYLETGSKKLRLLAGVEDEQQREQLLQQARDARATTQDVARKVAEVTGKPTRAAAAKTAPEPAPAKKPPAKGGREITLMARVGGKAQRHQFHSAKTGRPIAHFRPEEGDYVEVSISENVVLQIAPVMNEEGKVTGITTLFVEVAS